jgi:Sulfotransferase domain
MIIVSKNNPKGIIWIASYPRSGNTWTRAFINGLFNIMRDPAYADVDINRIEEFSAAESTAALYLPHLGKPAFRATPAEIAAARPKVQADIVARAGRPIFVKTHNANLLDHGVPLINMAISAGGIYVVRNPLDVAISFAHFRGISIDQVIDDMATPGFGTGTDRDNVRVITGSWSEHVQSWTGRPHPAVLTVRYEDMIDKPDDTFAGVARHLLLAPSDEQLQRAIGMAGFDRLRDKEAVSGFVEKPNTSTDLFFREGRAGQWRERLNPEQVERVVAAHRPVMERFGYLP